MIKRTIRQVRDMVKGEIPSIGLDDVMIEGVSTDTRSIKPGCLFIPLVGAKFDGHQYVEEAFAKGASAVLWQKDREYTFEGRPVVLVDDTLRALQRLAAAYRDELPVRIIGITGSNGKTTTKDMTASILATTYKVHKTRGNLNNHIGLPLTMLEFEEDTEMAVLEMGMSARGEIALLSQLAKPEVALITNIGEAHLAQLGSRLEIARAKAEILSGLMQGGLFVYNGDEPLIEEVLPDMPQPEDMLRFRFGDSISNDIHSVAVLTDGEGTYFKTNLPNTANYYMPLLGDHNVTNALAAIAVCKYMGVTDSDITKGLRNLEMTGMRIEMIRARSGATLFNDAYNASPTSMRAALRVLANLKGFERKIAVLGDMLELGSHETEFHREIGAVIRPDECDYLFTYGPLAKHIAAEAAKKMPRDRIRAYLDKDLMIRELMKLVSSGDVVLVKASRGMKLEEVVEALKDA